MKTINKLKATALMMLSLCATSCLDFQPLSSLGDDYVWTSSSNFQLFANNFYSYDRGYASIMSDGPYHEMRGDMIQGYGSDNDYAMGVHVVPNEDSNYGTYYKRIYYCNLLLKNAAEYGDQESISTPMGEAYFHRAQAHYELLHLYGDNIVLTEPLDITSERLYATQDNRSVVMDQVIADYKMAAELLPETASETGRLTKNIAMSMLARAALFEGTWQKFHDHCSTSSYSYDSNYSYVNFGSYEVDEYIENNERSTYLLTVAKEAAEYVMNSGAYTLFYNSALGSDSYRAMFCLEDAAQCNVANVGKTANTEYIYIDRRRDGDTGTAISHGLLYNAWVVNRKMVDMYLCQDGLPIDISSQFQGRDDYETEFENRDPRMTTSIIVYGQTYWKNDDHPRIYWDDRDLEDTKTATTLNYTGYHNRKWGIEREVQDTYESPDFPIIRYAEILLAYAEATYELTGSISDEDLDKSINLIRGRVNMPSLTNEIVTSNASKGMNMRQELRRERTVELYGEGLRLDDIRRWATAKAEMETQMVGVQITGTVYEYASWGSDKTLDEDGNVVLFNTRSWDNTKHYLYPLPSDELQLNPNLKQNAGWE